jgi:16S rRNA processing protein RimM
LRSSSSTVDVGFVIRAHGVRGVVRVRSASDALGALPRLWLDDEEYRVVHASRDKEDWLVTLDGVTDRDAAEALRGRTVRVERAAVPVADDELLVSDLVGCKVFDVGGAELGEVTGSFDSGAHEVLEVRTADGKEFMLPLVDAIVTAVDLEARKIMCDPPPGLVNLDEAE